MNNQPGTTSSPLYSSSISSPSSSYTSRGDSASMSDASDPKSLLDLWSSLHSGGNNGGENEMLVVRNTFLELCKFAETQSIHNPDRFVSAPAMFSFTSDEAASSSDTTPTPPVVQHGIKYELDTSSCRSTVMVRNIPTRISSSKLIETVLSYKIPVTSLIDFLYLPIDFKTNKNLGYCFINFTSDELADEC